MSQTALAPVSLTRGAFGLESPEPLIQRLITQVDVPALAAIADESSRRWHRWRTSSTNPSGDGRRLPLALAPVLEITAGSTALAQWHCAQVGLFAVRRPVVIPAAADIVGHLAALSSEFAAVQKTTADALADHRVVPDEARDIVQRTRDLARQAETFAMAMELELLRKPLAPAGAR